MAYLARAPAWLRSVVGRRGLEAGMDSEIRFHLEARVADLMGEGLTSDEATRLAHSHAVFSIFRPSSVQTRWS